MSEIVTKSIVVIINVTELDETFKIQCGVKKKSSCKMTDTS